jgi:hypothetical protein
MADIQIVMEVLGNEGIVSATKSTVKLENTIKSLSKSLDSGRISDQQFNTALKELRRTLDNNGKSWQANKAFIDRYVDGLRQAEKAQEQSRSAQESLNQARKRSATVLALQGQRLREEAAAQKVAAAGAKQQEATLDRLRHKYIQGHTAMELYSKEMNDLAVARKNNIISARQQSEAVEKLNNDYAKGVGVFSKFNQAQLAATKGSNRMGVVTQQAGYQVSDFIVQVQSGTNPFVAFSQQASQLAGVLPLVAGNIGLTTTAAIALSAGLGIGIPLVGAIGAALWSTSSEAKNATEVFDKLTSAISDYSSVAERLQDADFSENFGLFADQAERALAAIKELKQAEINESIRNVLGGNVERRSTGPTIQNIRAAADILGVSGFSTSQEDKNLINEYLGLLESLQNAKGFNAQVEAADKLNSFIKANIDLTKLEGEQREQINGLLELTVDLAEQAGKANQNANSHVEDYLKNQLKFVEKKKKADEEVFNAQQKLGEEQVKLLQAQGKYAEATELAVKLAREEARAKALSSAENETQRRALEAQAIQAANLAEQAVRLTEQTRQTKEETKLAAKEAKDYADAINKGLEKRDQFEQKALTALVGKLKAQGNLLAAEKLEVELAREAAVQKVLSTATTIEGKNALVASAIAAADAAEQAVRLGYETDGIKNDARELEKALNASASAMDRMSSSSLNLHVQIAQAKAEAAALAAGLDVSVARSTAKARETYQAQYLEASGAAQMAGDLDAMEQAQRIYNEQLEGLKVLDTLMQSNAATKGSQKGSSRTTDPIKSGTEYIERVLKPEIELRKKSALMSDEQMKRAEFEFELRQRVDKYKEKASEKEIQAAMTLYDQAVRLERVGDIIDYSQGQFENFFMTVVDGTTSIEDAFKGMLRNILLEIYKQQVAKPAAEGIGNLLRKGAMAIFGGGQTTASAYGNVFQNGSVKAFADGGIVSSPTFFPMSNGTGLMGEAGPEAIMPLKRGPNGKLGVEASGGQQVVVNQSFNFAANGDESVKKIIAQAAPQIAQMTQKQIMDSRRRGGQMKAAFS